MVKNPNWQEANQLAICKLRPRSWTRDYSATTPVSGQNGPDLNPQPPDFKSGALTTRPRCLLANRKKQTSKSKWRTYNELICFNCGPGKEKKKTILIQGTFSRTSDPIKVSIVKDSFTVELTSSCKSCQLHALYPCSFSRIKVAQNSFQLSDFDGSL